MCQHLMGLSIEMPSPADPNKIDIVVLTVTVQTAGSHTLIYESYHLYTIVFRDMLTVVLLHRPPFFFTPEYLPLIHLLKQFSFSVITGNYRTT